MAISRFTQSSRFGIGSVNACEFDRNLLEFRQRQTVPLPRASERRALARAVNAVGVRHADFEVLLVNAVTGHFRSLTFECARKSKFIQLHVHTHTHTHTFIHTHTHTQAHTHIHTYPHSNVCNPVCAHVASINRRNEHSTQ